MALDRRYLIGNPLFLWRVLKRQFVPSPSASLGINSVEGACPERVQLWLPFAYSQRGRAALFHVIKNTPIPVGIGGCCFWGPGVV